MPRPLPPRRHLPTGARLLPCLLALALLAALPAEAGQPPGASASAPAQPDSLVYEGELSGVNVNPPRNTSGSGRVRAVVLNDSIYVTGQFEGLVGDFTATHIHRAAVGSNGGVQIGLTPTLAGDRRSGTYERARNGHPFDADLQAALADILVPQLRDRLQSRLPDFMIPATFVLMEGLPRMPNGKIDRRNLPVPDTERPKLDTVYVEPRTATEEAMVDIWAAVLRLETIGIYDDFFADLGGHSLLATQLMSRVRNAFDVEIPLRRLFEAPTIAAVSEAVDQAMGASDGAGVLRSITSSPAAPADALSDEEVDAMLKRMLGSQ